MTTPTLRILRRPRDATSSQGLDGRRHLRRRSANWSSPPASMRASTTSSRSASSVAAAAAPAPAGNCLTADAKTKIVAMGDAFADRAYGSHGELEKQFKRPHRRAGRSPLRRLRRTEGHRFGCDLVILATPPRLPSIHFTPRRSKRASASSWKTGRHRRGGVRKDSRSHQEGKERGLGVGVGLQRHHQAVAAST